MASKGELARVLLGLGSGSGEAKQFAHAKLARLLPGGNYVLEGNVKNSAISQLAWAMGGYSFDRYRKRKHGTPKLVVEDLENREAPA